MEWNISRAWTSSEGSSGVIFVSVFQENKTTTTTSESRDENKSDCNDQTNKTTETTFVLKGCSRIAEELFSNK